MILTDNNLNDLQKEIDHILDSGANSIRLINMFEEFLQRTELINQLPISHLTVLSANCPKCGKELQFEVKEVTNSDIMPTWQIND